MASFLPDQPIWEEEISLLPAPLAYDPALQILERLAARISALDPAHVLTLLIDAVDSSALPHLAWQFSMLDEPAWILATTDEQRRALIKGAIELHRHKGTPSAIRQLIRLLGFGEVEIQEGMNLARLDGTWALDGAQPLGYGSEYWLLDGTVKLDGSKYLGDSGAWAQYRLVMHPPISNSQAALLRKALGQVAPARCLLKEFDYSNSVFPLNGTWFLDGTYNLGTNVI